MSAQSTLILLLTLGINGIHASGLGYSGSSGTQLNRDRNDPLFYSTHSNLPHLPFLTGFYGTHGTYRFMTINEQTAVIIGDGKHGLWRVQDNGFVREYRKKGKIGLPVGVDPNSPSTLLNKRYADIIKQNYASYIPEESWSGYKYPDQKISDGSEGFKGYQNFIDITIYHPKFGGKYEDHVPLDLPFYYCTMSQGDYPHARRVWESIRAQPRANEMGPLARRAGFDIKENVLNVVRLHFFEDASVWINVGVGDQNKDRKFRNLNDIKTHMMSVNMQKAALNEMNYEIYLIERTFFNKPHLFITLIMENKAGLSDHAYIRPHGHYWDNVKKRFNVSGMNHAEPHYPVVPIENYPTVGQTSKQTTKGLPVYALHNPHRRAFKLSGGACPEKGGDYARYPYGNPGAGWPTNYEEVTPICDGVLMDVKVWGDLDKNWNSPEMFLANAAFDTKVMTYLVDPNVYGKYSDDPYLKNRINPHIVDYTSDGKSVEPPSDGKPQNPVSFKMEFARLGKHLNYNNVSSIHEVPPNDNKGNNAKTTGVADKDDDDKECKYQDETLALLIVVLVLVIIICIENIGFFVYLSNNKCNHRDNDAEEARPSSSSTKKREIGIDNQASA